MSVSRVLKVWPLYKKRDINFKHSYTTYIRTCTHTHTRTHTHTHAHTHKQYLYNGVNRASFLTEAAVDTLGHVNVIAGRPPATVLPLLSFNRDGLWVAREDTACITLVRLNNNLTTP